MPGGVSRRPIARARRVNAFQGARAMATMLHPRPAIIVEAAERLRSRDATMISGVHAIIFTRDADAVRAFLRDVIELPSVDAGGGWPIFALPPAELAAHPTDDAGHHELYLMCDDIEAAMSQLVRKGVEVSRPIVEERWGRVTAIQMPDGGELRLYQPKHPTPPHD